MATFAGALDEGAGLHEHLLERASELRERALVAVDRAMSVAGR
jgi:hypothetical protein